MHLNNKRILICQPILYGINGSTMVTLELAQKLNEMSEVTVYTTIQDSPAREIFSEKNIKVVTFEDDPDFKLEDFDIIWVHSQIMPKSIIRDMKRLKDVKKPPLFIFLHMSPLENFSDERPWIYDFENRIADKVLCISDEVKDVIKPYLKHDIEFFRNPAPDSYIKERKEAKALEKVLIVSSHCPEEVMKAKMILENDYNIEVKLLGEKGEYRVITPELIEDYDALITIGKTVQTCLLSNTPVYIYDYFGGDGYLDQKNYESNKRTNFSGRNNRTQKSGEEIAKEIVKGYSNCYKYLYANKKAFKEEYSLSKSLERIFRDIKLNKKQSFDDNYIRYIEAIQDLARHHIYYGSYAAYKQKVKNYSIMQENEELIRKNNELYDEINGIKNSKTYRFARKLSAIIRGKKKG